MVTTEHETKHGSRESTRDRAEGRVYKETGQQVLLQTTGRAEHVSV